MNRLRKKSDAHYSQDSLGSTTLERAFSTDALPQLPTTNDFRTSLILPDLSRRFSLLRSSTSDPAAFDNHLRSRLADQRARGAVNQISEEEEDMLLNALGRIRIRHNAPDKSQENSNGIDATIGDHGSDANGLKSPISASPGSRSGKRYSNNLFASGRLRDYTYLKNVNSPKSSASSTRTVSLTPTEISVKKMSTSSLLPSTPERTTPTMSVQPSPSATAEIDVDEEEVSHADNILVTASDVEHQLQNQLGPINLGRASMALQLVMKEIEDELEEEILLPRTTPTPRVNLDQAMHDMRDSQSSRDSSVFEGGMAISIDKTTHDDASDRGASPIPARTVPGYVPGMPRPMTPRNIDLDEQRSLSTTPRAQSPTVAGSAALSLVPNSPSKVRRDSTSSITKPVAVAPLFLQRSTNGRFTPTSSPTADEYQRDGPEYDNSSVFNRRRPSSPLVGLSYQSFVPNRPNSRSNSRPSTPSNVVWTPNSSANGHSRRASHSRSNSLTTDTDLDYRGPLGALTKPSGPRALRSPPLPDSVSLESEQIKATLTTDSNGKDRLAIASTRPQGIIGDVATMSPPSSPPPRNLTPTQNVQRSPTSPVFAKRSSRQNPPSSPFNITAFSALGLSARANSSRSSLDSVGSSFHSWDEPEKVFSVFTESKENQVLWHDFADLDKSSSVTPASESDAEDVLKRYGGLKKADIAAIQDKLLNAAFMKLANTDPRDRAPSALRRRRPSTSQSNYTRIASPPPQTQPPASPTHATGDDQYLKASALLNSVVESIKDQPSTLSVPSIARVPSSSSDEKEVSPSTRRNRALARVLFGEEDSKDGDSPISKAGPIKSIPEPEPIVSTSSTDTTRIPSTPPTSNFASNASYVVSSSPPISAQSSMSQTVETSYLHRNASVTKVPQTPSEQADLVREVQKKAEAAMIALNKTSSSSVNLPEGLSHSSSIRRRVDPKNISKPKLVSTSTNLDALPLTKLNNNSTSKLSSRFRRLRGSLRVKNVASSGEETITPVSLATASPTQAISSDNPRANESNTKPPSTAGSEHSRFKIPLQSPVSSGPGLKGFMARFRNKQRMSEPIQERPLASPTIATAVPVSPRSVDTVTPGIAVSASEGSYNTVPRSPGQPRPMYSRFPPANLLMAQAPKSTPPAPKPQSATEPQPPESPTTEQSRAALQQLFRAANDLGLDQNALTDLLSRSGSVSSRNLLDRSNTVTASKSGGGLTNAEPVSHVSSTGSDQTATPTDYTNPPSLQEPKFRARPGTPVAPDDSTVQKSRRTDQLRRPKDVQTENNPVVRITRVYANDAPELAALINRKNSTRRKRTSTASVSSRSVHDRVPTPPPPKAAKRFSADRMPPVPLLPNGLGQGGPPVAPSASITSHLQSTYESLYDMYSGDSRVVSMAVADDGQMTQETQPALEVIELANGETVWNVINGLRDGDEGSVYSRGSFVSEYSTPEAGSDVAGKGQSRSDARRSVSPLFSSKKGQQLQGKSRPETKVFYSTSEQIGRLIENLSQGADAGSFNFVPNVSSDRSGHSKSSSLSTNEINWTVEERLERMLGAMTTS